MLLTNKSFSPFQNNWTDLIKYWLQRIIQVIFKSKIVWKQYSIKTIIIKAFNNSKIVVRRKQIKNFSDYKIAKFIRIK